MEPLAAERLPVPAADPDSVRAAAREILARREFRPEPRTLLERAFDAVGDLVGRLLEAVAGGGSAGVVAVVMIVAATAIVAWAVVRLVRSTTFRSDRAAVLTSADDVGRSPRAWLDDADGHERAGEWRDAVRCRYRALVAELAGRGLVEEIPGRTSGEYVRVVGANLPAGAPSFRDASRAFDRVWYGRRPAGPADAAAVRAAMADVLRVAA